MPLVTPACLLVGVLFPVMIGTLFQQVLAACYGALLRRFQLRFTFYAAVFTKKTASLDAVFFAGNGNVHMQQTPALCLCKRETGPYGFPSAFGPSEWQRPQSGSIRSCSFHSCQSLLCGLPACGGRRCYRLRTKLRSMWV